MHATGTATAFAVCVCEWWRKYEKAILQCAPTFDVGRCSTRRHSRHSRSDTVTRSPDVLHVGVKRDPTNFSTPAMLVTL